MKIKYINEYSTLEWDALSFFFFGRGMRQRHIQFIEFGCIYENFVWYVRMGFCMAELYVHEHRNNMAMSWTLLESMLISVLADGTVAVDDVAASKTIVICHQTNSTMVQFVAKLILGCFVCIEMNLNSTFAFFFLFNIFSHPLHASAVLLHLHSRSHRVSVRIRF